MALNKATALSLTSELRHEMIREGFTLRDETSTSFELGSTNADGESKTVYVDTEEMSVCISENDEAGRLTSAEKYLLRSRNGFEQIRTEIFKSI